MRQPQNSITVEPFTESTFITAVKQASRASSEAASLPQIDYLAKYGSDIGARTLLVESHYIDRHFIEEVGRYYSRCLGDCPHSSSRIHLFSSDFDDSGLDEMLVRAATEDDGAATVSTQLSEAYRFYIGSAARVCSHRPNCIGAEAGRLQTTISCPRSLQGASVRTGALRRGTRLSTAGPRGRSVRDDCCVDRISARRSQ